MTADSGLDVLYPGLCDDCAEKTHAVVHAATVDAAAAFDEVRGDLVCAHTLPKRPHLIAHVVRDLLCPEDADVPF